MWHPRPCVLHTFVSPPLSRLLYEGWRTVSCNKLYIHSPHCCVPRLQFLSSFPSASNSLRVSLSPLFSLSCIRTSVYKAIENEKTIRSNTTKDKNAVYELYFCLSYFCHHMQQFLLCPPSPGQSPLGTQHHLKQTSKHYHRICMCSVTPVEKRT